MAVLAPIAARAVVVFRSNTLAAHLSLTLLVGGTVACTLHRTNFSIDLQVVALLAAAVSREQVARVDVHESAHEDLAYYLNVCKCSRALCRSTTVVQIAVASVAAAEAAMMVAVVLVFIHSVGQQRILIFSHV